MRRFIIFFLLIWVILISNKLAVFSQDNRFAVCDLCGYCPTKYPTPPSNWADCVKCIYPEISPDPSTKETLEVGEDNLPPTPYPGRYYTMLGCINTNLASFQEEGAGAKVIQFILNIVFSIVGGVAFVSFLYGAFIIATSQNNPERLNYGKRVVYGALAGLIFSLSAVFLVNFLASKILKIPGFNSP